MTTTREQHRRYNASDKGRARYERYVDKLYDEHPHRRLQEREFKAYLRASRSRAVARKNPEGMEWLDEALTEVLA